MGLNTIPEKKMAEVTLKGNPVQISGNLPPKGAAAPDFQLVNGDLADRSLQDYRGKRKMIYIVPSLDTSVCLLSTKKFNERIKTHPEVFVLIVSSDLPFAQNRACAAEGASNVIPLSMMRNKDFALSYGVLIQNGPLAGICARAVVVLDENDRVVYTQLVPEISQEPDYEKALEALMGKSV